MVSYPVEIRRCQHIKIGGTQCGSPALRGETFCYYHRQYRPLKVECYSDGEYATGEIVLPEFEDATSIQFVLRQVTQMLLQKRIERKTAGLILYALQIASSNLKRMEAEKPRPTQVVVDPETAAETPIGMTPWSASGKGHDPEEEIRADSEKKRTKEPTFSDWQREQERERDREGEEWRAQQRASLVRDPEACGSVAGGEATGSETGRGPGAP